MNIHELKTWIDYYRQVIKGYKTFEVRKNDRNFQGLDLLHLKEWDNQKEEYTGRECFCRVGYVLSGGSFGIEKGYCVMSIELINIAWNGINP